MTKTVISVEGKKIGEEQPCFVVAEAGVNHNGNLNLAKWLITAAKEAGADAVKFQIFIPEQIVSPNAAKADYQKETTGEGSQFLMLKKLALLEDEFRELSDFAKKAGIIFFATPHDLASVDIFERLNLPIIKVASSDVNNGLLFKKIAESGKLQTKPLFLSTGASTLDEVKKSVGFLRDNGFAGPILIYHCVSAYPALPREQNLRVIETFKNDFYDLPIGFSDNSGDIDILKAAVYLGAVSIETNITIDRNMEGPDHRISSEPPEFAKIVKEIRAIENDPSSFAKMLNDSKIKEALGDGIKQVQPSEVSTMQITRKSIVAARDFVAGDLISLEMLSARRPMGELSPMEFELLLGKKLKHDVRSGDELTTKDVG